MRAVTGQGAKHVAVRKADEIALHGGRIEGDEFHIRCFYVSIRIWIFNSFVAFNKYA